VQISGQARLFRNSDYGAGTGDDASRVQSTASGFEFVLRPLAVCLVASGQGLLTTGFSMPDQRLGTQASGAPYDPARIPMAIPVRPKTPQ
jgi:hypothetical protein